MPSIASGGPAVEYEGAAGEVEQLKARHAGLLSDLALVLRKHGEPVPGDAASAKANLGTLSDRSTQLAKAREDERRAIGEVEQASTEHSATVDAIARVYKRASVDAGDLPTLAALLPQLPAYRDLIKSAERLESQIRLDRDELAKAGEGGLADCDRPTLERLKEGLSSASDQAETMRNEIADIRARANEARQGSSLQDLMAEMEKTRATLKDRRDEALLTGAGRFLIDRVEQEFEKNQMPRVLERARRHFSDFTHHGYELRLARDTKHPRLFAIELRNNMQRELDELSEGTRAQLLLAARVAFAEEVERGTKLPLFLDEALDQSDPTRFDAIAHSLGQIAHNDGQADLLPDQRSTGCGADSPRPRTGNLRHHRNRPGRGSRKTARHQGWRQAQGSTETAGTIAPRTFGRRVRNPAGCAALLAGTRMAGAASLLRSVGRS